MDAPPPAATCRYCRGTGLVTLLNSRVACDCQLDRDIEAALADIGMYLSVRTRKVVIQRQGIRTIRQLLAADPAELLKAKSVGPITIAELRMVLKKLGCSSRAWSTTGF